MAKNGTLGEVFKKPRRTAWIALRATPAEKESVRTAARRVGCGMSAYLLALHAFAIGAEKRDA